MARSDSARASATLRWTRSGEPEPMGAFRGAPRLCRGASERSGGLGSPWLGPPSWLGSPIVDGELDEVVVGITEVDAGRHAARARAWPGPSLRRHAVPLEQREDLVDGPVPFETEIGAARRWPPRAEVARARRRLRSVDVDLLRVVDPDRRHVRAARPLFPGDREAEPLVEVQRPLEIARDDDPVVDALDAHGLLLPPLSPAIFSPTLS